LVKHEDNTPLNSTLEWLSQGQHRYSFCNLHLGETLPDLKTFDAVILHGGEMNVDQEDKFPWLRTEKEFIKKAIAQNKKILGICLGAQLIADTLGARVSKHPHWEVGWFPVDVLLSPEPLQVFQWHGYSFDLPPGAKLIASGTHWKNQGYMIGQQIAAFQFHPESTDTWIIEAASDKKPAGESPLVQNQAEILQLMPQAREKMTKWYYNFLDYFFIAQA
jgi:GMP synthase-like glutamine amidotransferase